MFVKILALIVVAVGGYMFYKNTTLPDHLGVVNGKFAPMPSSPNAVSSQSDDPEKAVDALPFEELQQAKQSIKSLLERMGGNTIHAEQDKYMHVIFTTPTMKYNDDVEFYFNTDANIIEFRSQSRVGYSDRGLNRDRYLTISNLYKNNP